MTNPGAPTIIRIHCQPRKSSPIQWLMGHAAAQPMSCPPRKMPSELPPMNPSCSKPIARGNFAGGKWSASSE
jgi:hypothetical protein